MNVRFGLFALAVVALSAPAGAQDRDAASHDERGAESARGLFELGVSLMRDEKFTEAADAFRRSYAANPNVAALCNLAVAYDRGEDFARAVDTYQECAVDDEGGRYRDRALARARELRAAGYVSAREATNREPDEVAQAPAPAERAAEEPTTALPVTVAPRRHGLLWGGMAAGFGSLAAVVGGVVLNNSVSSKREKLARRYPDGEVPGTVDGEPNPDVGLLHDAERQADWRDVLYGTGIGLAVAGIALGVADLVLTVRELRNARASVQVGLGSAGLTVRY